MTLIFYHPMTFAHLTALPEGLAEVNLHTEKQLSQTRSQFVEQTVHPLPTNNETAKSWLGISEKPNLSDLFIILKWWPKNKKQIRKRTCVLVFSWGLIFDTVSSLANSPGCCWSLENHHCFTTWLMGQVTLPLKMSATTSNRNEQNSRNESGPYHLSNFDPHIATHIMLNHPLALHILTKNELQDQTGPNPNCGTKPLKIIVLELKTYSRKNT